MKLEHLLLTRTFFKLGEKNDFIFISLAQILKFRYTSNPNIWTKCSGIQQW